MHSAQQILLTLTISTVRVHHSYAPIKKIAQPIIHGVFHGIFSCNQKVPLWL